MQESLVQLLGQEDSLEKEMATHSSILAWKIPMDRGIRKSIIHGVTRVRHDLGLNHHQQEGDGKSKHQILGINKLKWMGMREFNSDSHCIFSWGPESHRRNRIALIISQKIQNTVLGYNLKNDRMILVCLQGKPFNIRVIQVHAPITDSEEVEADQFCENLEDLLVLTPNKDVLFIRDWIAKEGSQDMPGVTGKFGLGEQNEAGKTLTDSAKRMY